MSSPLISGKIIIFKNAVAYESDFYSKFMLVNLDIQVKGNFLNGQAKIFIAEKTLKPFCFQSSCGMSYNILL